MTDLHCPRCGYSLRGNTSGQCPECGQAATPRDILDRLAHLRQTWERSYRLAVRVVSLQSFAFLLFSLFRLDRVPTIVLASPVLLFLATAIVVAIRLGYDRGRYFALEQSVRHGRPTGVMMHVYSVLLSVVFFVGVQSLLLAFGLFMIAAR